MAIISTYFIQQKNVLEVLLIAQVFDLKKHFNNQKQHLVGTRTSELKKLWSKIIRGDQLSTSGLTYNWGSDGNDN